MTHDVAGPSVASSGSLVESRNTGDAIMLSGEDMDLAAAGVKVSYVGKVFVGVHEHRRAVATLVAERKLGRQLKAGELIAFQNRNRLDMRRENVLVVSPAARMRYAGPQRGHSSRYKGVSWQASRGKWYAQIRIDGRTKNLGRFDEEEDAARAYDKAVRGLGIDIAFTNFGD